MAGWLKIAIRSFAAAAAAGAAQLGSAQALAILGWSTAPAPDVWRRQLTWVMFIFATAVLVGVAGARRSIRTVRQAIANRRVEAATALHGGVVPARDGVRASGQRAVVSARHRALDLARRIAIGATRVYATLFASLGAFASFLLVWLSARNSLPAADIAVLALAAALGIGVGAVVALLSLVIAPVAANAAIWLGAMWIFGVASAGLAIATDRAMTASRLGVLDAPDLIGPGEWWLGPITMVVIAALFAFAVAATARRSGAHPATVAISGLAGPGAVAAIYVIVGADDGLRSAYWSAIIAAVVGAGASAATAFVRKRATKPTSPEPAVSTGPAVTTRPAAATTAPPVPGAATPAAPTATAATGAAAHPSTPPAAAPPFPPPNPAWQYPAAAQYSANPYPTNQYPTMPGWPAAPPTAAPTPAPTKQRGRKAATPPPVVTPPPAATPPPPPPVVTPPPVATPPPAAAPAPPPAPAPKAKPAAKSSRRSAAAAPASAATTTAATTSAAGSSAAAAAARAGSDRGTADESKPTSTAAADTPPKQRGRTTRAAEKKTPERKQSTRAKRAAEQPVRPEPVRPEPAANEDLPRTARPAQVVAVEASRPSLDGEPGPLKGRRARRRAAKIAAARAEEEARRAKQLEEEEKAMGKREREHVDWVKHLTSIPVDPTLASRKE